MDNEVTELAKYLQRVLKDRNLSIRAFANYAGLAHGTIQNILASKPTDPATIRKLAEYLNEPIDNLYRMAGMLPEDEERSKATRLIEHLFAKLPESDQQEVIDIIKLKIERQSKH